MTECNEKSQENFSDKNKAGAEFGILARAC